MLLSVVSLGRHIMPSDWNRQANLGHVVRSNEQPLHYLRLCRFPRPGDGTSGEQSQPTLLRKAVPPRYAAAATSLLQRKVVPSNHKRCNTLASLRAKATLARFIPRRFATSRAQRFRAEKRTARVSMMCAAS